MIPFGLFGAFHVINVSLGDKDSYVNDSTLLGPFYIHQYQYFIWSFRNKIRYYEKAKNARNKDR